MDTCSSSICLQKLQWYDTLSMCLKHGKGGHSDCYGRVTDCRGGSQSTASIQRYGMAIAQGKEAHRISGIRFVAYSPRRFASVSGLTKTTSRITEANLFGLPVVPSLPNVLQALSSELYRTTSCYFNTMAMRLERAYLHVVPLSGDVS